MKMNERAAEILDRLQGLVTEDGALYTNAEIIEKCEELQEAMAKAVFEKTHAENMRSRDLLLHFDALAKEYNLRDTDLYRSFSAHARELGYTIGTYKKGMKGEKIARRALKLLSFDQGVKILYNVELEDEDLIEDVIVENKQAIEMASIYSGILNGTMDTFASVISNNQNSVMKFLATITIVLSIPTMIASFYGMNVNSAGMPFANSPWGFPIVIGISIIISMIMVLVFRKKDFF